MSVISFLITVGVGTTVNAQELNLFESVEVDTPQNTGPFQLPDQAPIQNGQPAFTLRSTSRVGDNYHSVLVNRDGSVAEVDWTAGGEAVVPGYENFVVVSIAGRQVALRHPGNEGCVNSTDLGVRCEGNIAYLSLENSAPVANNQGVAAAFGPAAEDPFSSALQGGGPESVQGSINGQVNQIVINPFSGEPEIVPQLSPEEQAARGERQAARAARLRQFEPERINEADVPDGMRLVRTPFGDRMVPIRQ